jgi:hypothetical protein
MALYLAPIINGQQVDVDGKPLNGGFIKVYLADSSTPATTYNDEDGLNQNTWPIVLNTLGVNAQGAIWLTGGAAYKFVVENAAGVVQRSGSQLDNISGINDTTVSIDQWIVYQSAPTYVSANSFTVGGDQTATFQPGRRVKTQNTGGLAYGTIISSSYGAPNTTVTVSNTSGALDAGLTQVSYGLISSTDSSIRQPGAYSGYRSLIANTALTAATAGELITISASSLTMTLPLGSTMVKGDTYTFQTAGAFILARSGADQIFGPAGLAANVAMYSNCSVTWTGSVWAVIMGGNPTVSAVVGPSNTGRDQAANGLLQQWGSSVVTLNASSIATITFPVPFTALYTVVPTNGDRSATTIAPIVSSNSASNFGVEFPGAGAISVRCNWIAYGLGS